MKTNANKNQASSYKWIAWGIIVLSYAINYFHAFSMGVVKDSIIMEFGLSESMFVSIASTYAMLYLIMQIPTGILVDSLGSRITSSVGTFIAAIGITLFSLTDSVTMLFIGRSLIGLGTSVIFVCILKLQSSWFEQSKLGTMTGITCFIGTLGGAVAQTPLAFLVETFGWRMSFRGIGVVSFIVAFGIYIIVRNTPEELGYEPVNPNNPNETKTTFSEVIVGVWHVFKNPRTWPPLVAYAGFYGSSVIIMGIWGTSFLTKAYNITTVEAAGFTTVAVVGSAIGAVVIGNMSDKYVSRKKPMIVSGIIYALSWALLILTIGKLSKTAMMILMFVNGFMSYAYVVCWSAVGEVNNPKYVGVSSSVANIGGFCGSMLLPLAVGLSFDKMSGVENYASVYRVAFGITLVAVIISVIAGFFLKETNCKNIYEEI
ncbi:MAG: MFS transporter [Anaeromicrobium sp.]|jgi:sugar phosphate permease|uniref:MFS transporter n=1 Tax=Anaeromicrobium sp. TaxID=1929132 RepID=UPI0025E2A821|nr:MFS transporter [Anaeromicrobium sp.]MCT4593414.1 MFS transporter [Anaeromicrobium sp.]